MDSGISDVPFKKYVFRAGPPNLDERRHALKLRKSYNTLLNVKRDKEDRSRVTLNNIMKTSNNINFTSHDNSSTTSSSNVNHNNNSTNSTPTSTNNSGNSNCNNTHNIMFNIHDLAGLNQHPGIFLQDYANMFSSQANMLLNAHHHQSPGMYQGYYGQGLAQ